MLMVFTAYLKLLLMAQTVCYSYLMFYSMPSASAHQPHLPFPRYVYFCFWGVDYIEILLATCNFYYTCFCLFFQVGDANHSPLVVPPDNGEVLHWRVPSHRKLQCLLYFSLLCANDPVVPFKGMDNDLLTGQKNPPIFLKESWNRSLGFQSPPVQRLPPEMVMVERAMRRCVFNV